MLDGTYEKSENDQRNPFSLLVKITGFEAYCVFVITLFLRLFIYLFWMVVSFVGWM